MPKSEQHNQQNREPSMMETYLPAILAIFNRTKSFFNKQQHKQQSNKINENPLENHHEFSSTLRFLSSKIARLLGNGDRSVHILNTYDGQIYSQFKLENGITLELSVPYPYLLKLNLATKEKLPKEIKDRQKAGESIMISFAGLEAANPLDESYSIIAQAVAIKSILDAASENNSQTGTLSLDGKNYNITVKKLTDPTNLKEFKNKPRPQTYTYKITIE
jgi:hypothetical protein